MPNRCASVAYVRKYLRSAASPSSVRNKSKGGKVGKLDPFQKDERGFDAAIGQEQLAAELRQCVSISSHASSPCDGRSSRARNTTSKRSQTTGIFGSGVRPIRSALPPEERTVGLLPILERSVAFAFGGSEFRGNFVEGDDIDSPCLDDAQGVFAQSVTTLRSPTVGGDADAASKDQTRPAVARFLPATTSSASSFALCSLSSKWNASKKRGVGSSVREATNDCQNAAMWSGMFIGRLLFLPGRLRG